MANSNGWGDGAANNSIGWGQGANNNIGWGDSHAKSWAGATDIVGITTDPASTEFFTATGITGATQQTAIDNLVKGLKADGLWSKMKAVYPFVTDNRNLLSYTEDFGNAVWSKANATVTTNSTTAPNGTLTADSFVENSANGFHSITNNGAFSLSVVSYTYSIYVKRILRDWVMISMYDGSIGRDAYFNIANGTIGNVTSGATATISDAGNGWYRCTMTMNFSASGNFFGIYGASANGTASYIGNGLASYYLWGAQLELGSTATTYQPIATTQQAFISSQFKYNLVNPVDSDAAFRLVFNGGWTHSSNGATPNGTNGYADTKIIPSSVLSTSNYSLGFYSRTDVNGSYTQMGSNSLFQIYARLGNAIYYDVMYPSRITVTNASSLGLFNFSRTTLNRVDGYKNGVNIGNDTTTVSSLPNDVLRVGAGYTYSPNELAYAYVSNGLTDTEAANLYTRVQAFQTALNRQV